MASWTTTLGDWPVHSALAGGLVLLIGLLLMGLTRQPARRQRLGEFALASALLVAALCTLPAWLPYSIPLLPEKDTATVAALVAEARPQTFPLPEPAVEAEEPVDLAAGPSSEDDWEEGVLVPPAVGAVQEAPPAPAEASSSRGADWLLGLGILYLSIVTLLLARCGLGYLGLFRWWRASQAPPAHVQRVFVELTQHWKRRPRLAVCPRLALPISFGLCRPTILLPQAFCRENREDPLRWVLVHELTHLERRDGWSCLLLALSQALYFYLPWFWWMRRQVRLCQEYVADAVAAVMATSEDYAQYLVSLSMLAPQRLPAGARASGVMGSSSDLFRRIAMLLDSQGAMERKCPRWWALAAAAGFLTVAVLLSGVGVRADAAGNAFKTPLPAEPAKKEEPKPEPKPEPKANPANPAEELLEQLQRLIQMQQPNLPADAQAELQKRLQEMMQRLRQMQQQLPNAVPVPQPIIVNRGPRNMVQGRFGATLQPVNETLANQLDLPKGQGQVIANVTADSPAEKAGIKQHDILLELNGKAVSREVADFAKAVEEIKPNTPVDAVVLRKGKKTEIKGLSLPEAPAVPVRRLPIKIRPIPAIPGAKPIPNLPNILPINGRNATMSISRQGNNFTATQSENGLKITVTGTVDNGKGTPNAITIDEAGTETKFDSVEKVPEQYREKVKDLVDKAAGGQVKFNVNRVLP